MKTTSLASIVFLLFASFYALEAEAIFGKKNVDKERAEVLEMREETLARLYDEKPSAEDMISKGVGYAVFSNTGVNLLLVSTANGIGIAHDNSSDKDTFMKMFSAGGGVGMGVKKFSAVFIFHSRDAFDQFVEKGWNFSGQADAAATTDSEQKEQAGSMEAAIGLNEAVTVYQMTDKGLALQITLQGTKYWQDEDLN
ncbi:MAG: YSC84-related protein [Gammaproteobacteria bacterium]|nr:YSC84-related protein [Gammaproteobacteria bacterium]MDH3750752.1 YSC84-related protein [Gammaproteobacteria bacterium]MDH3805246.1 YSC84-related protein [Gammaproteobacteria bacterium]